MTESAELHRILPVSRLVALLRELVEENFLQVAVRGEISNVAQPGSGHLYLTLKDESAQIRVVMFRTQARLLPFQPQTGMQVVVSGRVSIYPQRGEIQLLAETLEPAGLGSLQAAFEQLKARLAAEGLFAPERKRPLPPFPTTIGIVTSATGAAIHDIVTVLKRRGSGLRVVLAPVRVQGEGAAAEIAAAVADVNRHGQAEVLIVGRGGGSWEDLWSFNEEIVARAIAASRIPVISAVGHEVDFTIADFVADLRAPTPSAAAELVVRSRFELEGHVDHLILRLGGQIRGRLDFLNARLADLGSRLRSPQRELERRQLELAGLARRLERGGRGAPGRAEERLAALSGRLEALSPLRVLARGYAIVADAAGTPVREASQLAAGDALSIRFWRGRARARVEEVES